VRARPLNSQGVMRYLEAMRSEGIGTKHSEQAYWKAVGEWVKATHIRYRGCRRGDLTQCFMRGPFAGWSERQVAELGDLLAQNAERFPLREHEGLDWGVEEAGVECGETSDGTCCQVCRGCGEEGCCSVEKSILSHGCKYAEHYAKQACYDKMIIDEFHKLTEGMGLTRDETGSEPRDPIGDLYDRAWRRVEEKYGKV
jgi:hypothetical protein